MKALNLQPAFFTTMRVLATALLVACVWCVVSIARTLLRSISLQRTPKASQPELQAEPKARGAVAQLVLQAVPSRRGERVR
jgi:hypothetical protein